MSDVAGRPQRVVDAHVREHGAHEAPGQAPRHDERRGDEESLVDQPERLTRKRRKRFRDEPGDDRDPHRRCDCTRCRAGGTVDPLHQPPDAEVAEQHEGQTERRAHRGTPMAFATGPVATASSIVSTAKSPLHPTMNAFASGTAPARGGAASARQTQNAKGTTSSAHGCCHGA